MGQNGRAHGNGGRRREPQGSARNFAVCQEKIVHCGPIAAQGVHAVKAVNNCLNAAHLIVGGEALIALAKWGVQPDDRAPRYKRVFRALATNRGAATRRGSF